MTTVFANGFGQDVWKSCLWGGFPPLPSGAVEARLKGNWSWQNAFNSNPDSENLFHFFYNPTGPSATGLVDIGSVNNGDGSFSSSFDIPISLSQNMANLYVMNILRALDTNTGYSAQIQAQVSNIRVEVETILRRRSSPTLRREALPLRAQQLPGTQIRIPIARWNTVPQATRNRRRSTLRL